MISFFFCCVKKQSIVWVFSLLIVMFGIILNFDRSTSCVWVWFCLFVCECVCCFRQNWFPHLLLPSYSYGKRWTLSKTSRSFENKNLFVPKTRADFAQCVSNFALPRDFLLFSILPSLNVLFFFSVRQKCLFTLKRKHTLGKIFKIFKVLLNLTLLCREVPFYRKLSTFTAVVPTLHLTVCNIFDTCQTQGWNRKSSTRGGEIGKENLERETKPNQNKKKDGACSFGATPTSDNCAGAKFVCF